MSNNQSQSSQGNISYRVMPEQVTQQLNSNVEFIVVSKDRQSNEPRIWASGDPTQAQQLFQQAYSQLATNSTNRQTETA